MTDPSPACGGGIGGSLRRDSAAGDGVAVAHAIGEPTLAPALAAVLRAEHLAGPRDGVDLVRVFRMRDHPHHRRIGLDAVVEALPGLADIVAAVDGAVGAARRRA